MTNDEIAAVPAQLKALDTLYRALDIARSAALQAIHEGVAADELSDLKDGLAPGFMNIRDACDRRRRQLAAPEDAA